MFDPNVDRNQHYVPLFWQRRFAGADGKLYKLSNKHVSLANPKRLMSDDWIYTTFDVKGFASNQLEKAASKIESGAAEAFRALDTAGSVGSAEQQALLRWFMAFSACRHPDVMSMGHRRAKELAFFFADVHSMDGETFIKGARRFGISPKDALVAYQEARSLSAEALLEEAQAVQQMPPNDPALPQQIALDVETIERLFFLMAYHQITILDAPPGTDFILGDTPFPAALTASFITPLSRAHALGIRWVYQPIALRWIPSTAEAFSDWTRVVASPADVATSNKAQADNALKVVIGPTQASLAPFANAP